MNSLIEIYRPSEPLKLDITPDAIAYIKKELSRKKAISMRLGVKEKAGCYGFTYIMDYLDTSSSPSDQDLWVSIDQDFGIYLDKNSLLALYGLKIDCIKDRLNTILKFNNPNEKGKCGCGESFSL